MLKYYHVLRHLTHYFIPDHSLPVQNNNFITSYPMSKLIQHLFRCLNVLFHYNFPSSGPISSLAMFAGIQVEDDDSPKLLVCAEKGLEVVCGRIFYLLIQVYLLWNCWCLVLLLPLGWLDQKLRSKEVSFSFFLLISSSSFVGCVKQVFVGDDLIYTVSDDEERKLRMYRLVENKDGMVSFKKKKTPRKLKNVVSFGYPITNKGRIQSFSTINFLIWSNVIINIFFSSCCFCTFDCFLVWLCHD